MSTSEINTDTHFAQPKITGYRQLTVEEVELMNQVKFAGIELEKLIHDVRMKVSIVDSKWINDAELTLQKGLMSLVRAIARPTTF